MVILVSEDDIRASGPGIIGNPIASAMSRALGARWRVWDGRVAQEMVAPYRGVALPPSVQQAWDANTDFSLMSPFAFEVELAPEESNATTALLADTAYAETAYAETPYAVPAAVNAPGFAAV